MEDLNLAPADLAVESLGPAGLPSPLQLSTEMGDGIANYVAEGSTVLIHQDRDEVLARLSAGLDLPAFEAAGPRQRIFLDPKKTAAAIVTCGGLCPGINNVIRTLVMSLYHGYGVRRILGIRYGYQGFLPEYGNEPMTLTPEAVRDIHQQGGSILASSRGEQDYERVVDWLAANKVNLLFAIGGDGTLRGAQVIHETVKRRGLAIGVVAIPKTIDNDISYVERTFGLETAFSIAAESIRAAHTEAIGAPNGVGIVKVMGRMSGFIAANAALALNEVNFVLVPEVPFSLEGRGGLFALLEERLRRRGHAVLIAAEGAGQDYVKDPAGKTDPSGNPVLGDIGTFLRDSIRRHFKTSTDIDVNLKYIDPSYLVRAAPANAHDAIYCIQLAQHAVHAGMAGKTGVLVGQWNSRFTHLPINLAVGKRKTLSPEDPLWLSVLESTGQPAHIG
jgi:6-phosphofructokinase 1